MLQRKLLRGTHLPVTVKDVQAGYLNNPYFKHVYLYVIQNKLPSHKATIRPRHLERYLVLDSLLFRLNTTPKKNQLL